MCMGACAAQVAYVPPERHGNGTGTARERTGAQGSAKSPWERKKPMGAHGSNQWEPMGPTGAHGSPRVPMGAHGPPPRGCPGVPMHAHMSVCPCPPVCVRGSLYASVSSWRRFTRMHVCCTICRLACLHVCMPVLVWMRALACLHACSSCMHATSTLLAWQLDEVGRRMRFGEPPSNDAS